MTPNYWNEYGVELARRIREVHEEALSILETGKVLEEEPKVPRTKEREEKEREDA